MSDCVKCLSAIINNVNAIACTDCKNNYHFECTNLKKLEKSTRQGAAKNSKWKCDQCKEESMSSTSRGSDLEKHSTSAVLESIENMRQFMQDQFNQVHSNAEQMKSQLANTNSSVEEIKVTLEDLKTENDSRKTEIASLVSENKNLKEELYEVKGQLMELQQYSRINNLEIVGVPLSRGENIYEILERLARVIKVPYRREDISIAHRLPVPRSASRNVHPKIIVSFTTRTAKMQWRCDAKKCKKLTAAELSDDWPSTSVFFNEHLTPQNKGVLGKARSLVRERKLAYAWTNDCRVFVKKTAEGPSVRIRSEEELRMLLN